MKLFGQVIFGLGLTLPLAAMTSLGLGAESISFSWADAKGDGTSRVDVVRLDLVWEPTMGAYAVLVRADPEAPFIGDFRVIVNVFNPDTGTTAQDPAFFTALHDFHLNEPQTTILLSGTDPKLTFWQANDCPCISTFQCGGRNPDGVSFFRSGVSDLPFGAPGCGIENDFCRDLLTDDMGSCSGSPPCLSILFDPLDAAVCSDLCFQLRDGGSGEVLAARCIGGIAGRTGLDVATDLFSAFTKEPVQGFGVKEAPLGCEFCRENGHGFQLWVQAGEGEFQPLKTRELNRVCGLVISPPIPPGCSGFGGDTDNDGWCDGLDNCPGTHNPAQLDSNGNGMGNACDSDIPVTFLRGDANTDGKSDISDAVYVLSFLFRPSTSAREFLACVDAADCNDDGEVDVSDPQVLLGYLFLGGPPPPAPFPGCGTDPAGDRFACELPGC